MHAFTIVSLLAAATMTSAAPTLANQERSECAPGTGYYQVCSNAWGVTFKGCCPTDACSKGYCPSSLPEVKTDPKPPVVPPTTNTDKTVCPAGTGYYQSCSNGFSGCCKSDACGSSWCPDYKYGTLTPKTTRRSDPTVCAPGTGAFYVCAKGNFRGCCKTDPCATGYCPSTSAPAPVEPKPNSNTASTECAPGTGAFYLCANGFRGCCKGADPCTLGYCPAAPAPVSVLEPPKPVTGSTECAPGTGLFYVCAKGNFRGCCKSDPCAIGYCPA